MQTQPPTGSRDAHVTTSQLVALIRETGREPVLRDTLYQDLAPVAEERALV